MAVIGGQLPEYTEPLEDNANAVPGELSQADADSILSDQFLSGAASEDMGQPAADLLEEPDEDEEEEGEELDEDEDEEGDEEEELAAKPQSKAQTRIRKLANERKALREQVAATQYQAQQQIQYAQQQMQAQVQQQRQQYEQQVIALQRQQELLQSKAARDEEANLSPMEQYERKILREAEERARGALGPEIAALHQKLEAQEQAQRAQYEEAGRQQRYATYTRAAQQGSAALLDGMDEKVAQTIDKEFQEMLLAYSAGVGMEPSEATPRMKQLLDRYVQGDMARRTNKRGKRVAKNPKQTVGPQPGRAARGSKSMPSLQTLNAHGFDNHVDWMARGEPSLKPSK